MKKIIFFIIFLSLTCSCTLIKHSPGKAYKKGLKYSYDAVIIPGFPYDNGEWNSVIKFRLLWAKHLYEKGIAKNFIFSGAAVHTKYNEGYIMAMYAHKMGIPKKNIFIEPNAKHSSENIYYSLLICKEEGFKKIAIATDPIQSFLISNYIERIRNTDIDYLTLQPRYIREHKFYDEPTINYELAIEEDFIPLKNKEKFWERKKASLGLQIDYGMRVDEYLKYSKWFRW